MTKNDSKSMISTKVLIDCLKHFQKHPEQFPFDLRAKFCNCTKSKHLKYSKNQHKINTKKIIHQQSNEFLSRENKSINNLKYLTTITEQLKDILQQKLKSQLILNDNQILSNYKRQDQNNDIIKTINYLIHHPDKILIKAINRLCKIATSHSIDQCKSKNSTPNLIGQVDVSDGFNRKVSLQTNEQQMFSEQKFIKHQPIPLIMFHLCCPPDMIPLTSKVATRLGININMINQQSQNKLNDMIINNTTSSIIKNTN
ncbi:unnamed protein product [Rotaria sordida]|uniref:Uncharacterized protein n=1 Tax=Rotaria sordida TaxID=392033 RepID=A0A815F3W6_9BILA|nr:unnamed protein product [Rotaria sordida]CAF1584183.1 unnamed protein product [Rotaria sordida]